MKTYQVVQDCVRMPFNKRRFRKGEIIELEDSIVPGGCFQLVEGPQEKPAAKASDTMSLSGLQQEQQRLSNPETGFASKGGRPKKKATR